MMLSIRVWTKTSLGQLYDVTELNKDLVQTIWLDLLIFYDNSINDEEEEKFLKGWHQVEGEEAAKDDEGDEVEVHVDVHLTVGL
jgi:hypothetical protein